MKWSDLSEKTRYIMEDMGNYSPVDSGASIKGYIGEDQEGQSYLDSTDLRDAAEAFLEVADFLEGKEKNIFGMGVDGNDY